MRNREEITSTLSKKVLLLDGSYGAEFIKRKKAAKAPELLNLEDPELVEELHGGYVEAGAEMLLTNTFGSTPLKLRQSGIEDNERIVREAVRIAKRAAGEGTLIIGNIGPTGLLPYPLGEGNFDLFYSNFKETARIMLEEGVDGIMLETFSDLQELKAGVLAVRDISKEVFLISMMTFDEGGRSLTGTDPMNFALTFNDLDVDAIGVNCSLGPEEMIPIFQEMARYSEKILVIEPNAGLPLVKNGDTVYPVGPEEFSGYVETFCELGANIIGGCCGTDVEHIRETARALGERPPVERDAEMVPAVTSPTSLVLFNEFVPIGERINPAGRKKLGAMMEEGGLDHILEEARTQVEAGARILDVNFGLESSVPAEFMERVILSIAYTTGIPVSLDVQTPELLERLMRIYPGRPLVNSSTCEKNDMDRKCGYIRDLGGMLILLPMEKEVPKSAEERIGIIEDAVKRIKELGLSIDRIVFDPIVLSLGAGNDPFETLRTIEHLSDKGLLSVCGLSNLSFGLPDRPFYNASFLSMAIERGLSSAIMNPLDTTLKGIMTSSLVITGRMEVPGADVEEEEGIIKLLMDGNVKGALEFTEEHAQEDPMDTLETQLKPAMERIGKMYSTGKIFLPQLILAAQTSGPCFDHIEDLLPKGAGKEKFIIATVRGDVHDIGKNIVAAIIRSSGYDVIDLGKDRHTEEIVEAVKRYSPLALGLSAMMTTTAVRIGEVVSALKEEGLEVGVIVGGASLNEKVAAEYGADLYAKNAVDALEFLKERKG